MTHSENRNTLRSCDLSICRLLGPSGADRRLGVELLQQVLGMRQVLRRLPTVLAVRVSLPLDQEFPVPVPMTWLMSDDGFHLIFFFSFYDVQWWSEEVRAVGFILMVGSQERCVEYWVVLPLIWQLQPIGPGSYYFRDGKGSVSFCIQLLIVLDEAQVSHF